MAELHRPPIVLLTIAVDVPRDPVQAERFVAGVRALCKEYPQVIVELNDSPDMLVGAETEDQLKEYVRRLTYYTQYGTDKGG
jgi:hypothetical protein